MFGIDVRAKKPNAKQDFPKGAIWWCFYVLQHCFDLMQTVGSKRQTTWNQPSPDLKSWTFGTWHWLVYIKCWIHRCWEKVLPQGGNHTLGNRKNLGSSWTLSWFHEISTFFFFSGKELWKWLQKSTGERCVKTQLLGKGLRITAF